MHIEINPKPSSESLQLVKGSGPATFLGGRDDDECYSLILDYLLECSPNGPGLSSRGTEQSAAVALHRAAGSVVGEVPGNVWYAVVALHTSLPCNRPQLISFLTGCIKDPSCCTIRGDTSTKPKYTVTRLKNGKWIQIEEESHFIATSSVTGEDFDTLKVILKYKITPSKKSERIMKACKFEVVVSSVGAEQALEQAPKCVWIGSSDCKFLVRTPLKIEINAEPSSESLQLVQVSGPATFLEGKDDDRCYSLILGHLLECSPGAPSLLSSLDPKQSVVAALHGAAEPVVGEVPRNVWYAVVALHTSLPCNRPQLISFLTGCIKDPSCCTIRGDTSAKPKYAVTRLKNGKWIQIEEESYFIVTNSVTGEDLDTLRVILKYKITPSKKSERIIRACEFEVVVSSVGAERALEQAPKCVWIGSSDCKFLVRANQPTKVKDLSMLLENAQFCTQTFSYADNSSLLEVTLKRLLSTVLCVPKVVISIVESRSVSQRLSEEEIRRYSVVHRAIVSVSGRCYCVSLNYKIEKTGLRSTKIKSQTRSPTVKDGLSSTTSIADATLYFHKPTANEDCSNFLRGKASIVQFSRYTMCKNFPVRGETVWANTLAYESDRAPLLPDSVYVSLDVFKLSDQELSSIPDILVEGGISVKELEKLVFSCASRVIPCYPEVEVAERRAFGILGASRQAAKSLESAPHKIEEHFVLRPKDCRDIKTYAHVFATYSVVGYECSSNGEVTALLQLNEFGIRGVGAHFSLARYSELTLGSQQIRGLLHEQGFSVYSDFASPIVKSSCNSLRATLRRLVFLDADISVGSTDDSTHSEQCLYRGASSALHDSNMSDPGFLIRYFGNPLASQQSQDNMPSVFQMLMKNPAYVTGAGTPDSDLSSRARLLATVNLGDSVCSPSDAERARYRLNVIESLSRTFAGLHYTVNPVLLETAVNIWSSLSTEHLLQLTKMFLPSASNYHFILQERRVFFSPHESTAEGSEGLLMQQHFVVQPVAWWTNTKRIHIVFVYDIFTTRECDGLERVNINFAAKTRPACASILEGYQGERLYREDSSHGFSVVDVGRGLSIRACEIYLSVTENHSYSYFVEPQSCHTLNYASKSQEITACLTHFVRLYGLRGIPINPEIISMAQSRWYVEGENGLDPSRFVPFCTEVTEHLEKTDFSLLIACLCSMLSLSTPKTPPQMGHTLQFVRSSSSKNVSVFHVRQVIEFCAESRGEEIPICVRLEYDLCNLQRGALSLSNASITVGYNKANDTSQTFFRDTLGLSKGVIKTPSEDSGYELETTVHFPEFCAVLEDKQEVQNLLEGVPASDEYPFLTKADGPEVRMLVFPDKAAARGLTLGADVCSKAFAYVDSGAVPKTLRDLLKVAVKRRFADFTFKEDVSHTKIRTGGAEKTHTVSATIKNTIGGKAYARLQYKTFGRPVDSGVSEEQIQDVTLSVQDPACMPLYTVKYNLESMTVALSKGSERAPLSTEEATQEPTGISPTGAHEPTGTSEARCCGRFRTCLLRMLSAIRRAALWVWNGIGSLFSFSRAYSILSDRLMRRGRVSEQTTPTEPGEHPLYPPEQPDSQFHSEDRGVDAHSSTAPETPDSSVPSTSMLISTVIAGSVQDREHSDGVPNRH